MAKPPTPSAKVARATLAPAGCADTVLPAVTVEDGTLKPKLLEMGSESGLGLTLHSDLSTATGFLLRRNKWTCGFQASLA
jgi:hypothetical protein